MGFFAKSNLWTLVNTLAGKRKVKSMPAAARPTRKKIEDLFRFIGTIKHLASVSDFNFATLLFENVLQ